MAYIVFTFPHLTHKTYFLSLIFFFVLRKFHTTNCQPKTAYSYFILFIMAISSLRLLIVLSFKRKKTHLKSHRIASVPNFIRRFSFRFLPFLDTFFFVSDGEYNSLRFLPFARMYLYPPERNVCVRISTAIYKIRFVFRLLACLRVNYIFFKGFFFSLCHNTQDSFGWNKYVRIRKVRKKALITQIKKNVRKTPFPI